MKIQGPLNIYLHWFCDFYLGKRTPDDLRQIGRWKKTAGQNSRFRIWLVNQIIKQYSVIMVAQQNLT